MSATNLQHPQAAASQQQEYPLLSSPAVDARSAEIPFTDDPSAHAQFCEGRCSSAPLSEFVDITVTVRVRRTEAWPANYPLEISNDLESALRVRLRQLRLSATVKATPSEVA